MIITRSIKSLESLVQQPASGKVETKLVEISSSLNITYFIPNDTNHKPEILPLLLHHILPLTCSTVMSLRFQADSFLCHLYSLLSSFSPTYLLTVYKDMTCELNSLDPIAQASLLTFISSALHYLSPYAREEYIGTCHSLLLNSDPKFLTHLTRSDWDLLSNSFSVTILSSIVKFLLCSDETKNLWVPIIVFLERDPKFILPIILRKSDEQFLKDIIPKIPNYIHIPLDLLKDKIIEMIKSTNTTFITGAIEIVGLLMERKRFSDEKKNWKEIFKAIENLWGKSSSNLTIKTAIIGLLSTAARQNMIPTDCLRRFLIFDKKVAKFQTNLEVSILRVCSIYVKNKKKLPKNLTNFLFEEIFERDPLIYVEIIGLMTECFHVLYEIAPNMTTRLLDMCLNPLPQYFVEQIAVIRLLRSINWSIFPKEKMKIKIEEIILFFLKKLHPSVMPEIKNLIDDLKNRFCQNGCQPFNLPLSRFDWFDSSLSSFFIQIATDCTPLFIIELLDSNMIPPVSFPSVASHLISILKAGDVKISNKLFKRSISVIFEAIKSLKLEPPSISMLSRIAKNKWESISSSLPKLLEVINDNILQTVFGKIISSCLDMISTTFKSISIVVYESTAIDLIRIATLFATAFTPQTCKLVSVVSLKFEMGQNFYDEVNKFFAATFKFDDAVLVSLTAIECLRDADLNAVIDYIKVASSSNRIVLLMRTDKSYLYNTFLAFKNDPDMAGYVTKCIEQIPYEQWQVEETDYLYIGTLRNIIVSNYEALDDIHRRMVEKCPESFVIQNRNVYDSELIVEEIDDSVNLGFEVFDNDFEDDIKLDYMGNVIQKNDLEKNKNLGKNENKSKKIELFSPYPGFEPSKQLLFAFLWNSNRKLTNDEFSKAENFAISLNNPLFNVALLSYALRINQIQNQIQNQNKKENENEAQNISKDETQDENEDEIKNKNKNEAKYKNEKETKNSHNQNQSTGFEVDINRWIRTIKVDRFNNTSILSFCISLSFIHKKWSDLTKDEISYIDNTIIELGFHDSSPYNLMKIYKEEHELAKMVAESIISVDPSRFDEFPFFEDIFLDRQNFEKKFDKILEVLSSFGVNSQIEPLEDSSDNIDESESIIVDGLSKEQQQNNYSFDNSYENKEEEELDIDYNFQFKYEIVSIFSRFLAPKPDISRYQQFFLPYGVPMIDKYYYPTSIILKPFYIYKEKDEIVNKLISFFEKSRICDNFLFFIIVHFVLSPNNFTKVIAPLSRYSVSNPITIFNHLNEVSTYEQQNNQISSNIFDRGTRTPSYTREVISYLMSPYSSRVMKEVPIASLKTFVRRFTPTAYFLLIEKFDTITLKAYDRSFPIIDEDILCFSKVGPESLNRLKGFLSRNSSSTCIIARQFFKLDSNTLCKYFKTVSADAAFIEISEKLIDTVINRQNYLSVALMIMNTILENTELMQLCMIAISEKFVNASQFVNVFLMLKLFEKLLDKAHDEIFKEMWNSMKESIRDKVSDKKRVDILTNNNAIEAFSKIINMS